MSFQSCNVATISPGNPIRRQRDLRPATPCAHRVTKSKCPIPRLNLPESGRDHRVRLDQNHEYRRSSRHKDRTQTTTRTVHDRIDLEAATRLTLPSNTDSP